MKVTMCASKQTGHAVGESPALLPPGVEIEFNFSPPRPDLRDSHVGLIVSGVDGPEILYIERDELLGTLRAMLEANSV